MKKLLTFAAALLASVAMMAQTTLFSATPLQTLSGKQTVSEAGEVQVTAEQATIAGGTFSLITDRSIDFIQKQSNNYAFAITATAIGYKIVLEHAIAEGDIVSVTALTNGSGESNGRGIFVTTANARQSTAICTLLSVSATAKEYVEVSHTVAAIDDLVGATTIYIWRATGNNTYFKDFAITRPDTRQIVSTVETLKAVTIDDVAISDANLAKLVAEGEIILEDAYVNAPVVKFTKHIVITYDDESTEESDEVIEKTSTQATASTWGASATIGGNTYTVYTVKKLSNVVTYKFGEQTLGTENVAQNGSPVEYAKYETMTLATFVGWYSNADLAEEHKVANIAAEVITAAKTYYAKFTLTYLTKNVNIEQLVLDYGKGYDIKSALTAAGWAYANIDALDSLNDEKTARNEPYLGLKLKTAGAYVQGRLQVDGILLVKFGNIGGDVKVTIKGATVNENTFTKEQLWSEDDQAYVLPVYGFPEDILVTISTTSASTVVLKQLMLDELAKVTLPDKPTAIDNAAVDTKAVKVIRDGQVIILRDGKTYNALGTEVR